MRIVAVYVTMKMVKKVNPQVYHNINLRLPEYLSKTMFLLVGLYDFLNVAAPRFI